MSEDAHDLAPECVTCQQPVNRCRCWTHRVDQALDRLRATRHPVLTRAESANYDRAFLHSLKISEE